MGGSVGGMDAAGANEGAVGGTGPEYGLVDGAEYTGGVIELGCMYVGAGWIYVGAGWTYTGAGCV